MVVRMRLQRIPEKHEQIYLSVRDAGPDLLIPAERPAVEPGHRQADFLAEHPAGGAGREQAVLGKNVAVELGPFTHVLLTAVVGDERDPAPRRCFGETVVGRHHASMPDQCCRHGTPRLAPCVRSSTTWPFPAAIVVVAATSTNDCRDCHSHDIWGGCWAGVGYRRCVGWRVRYPECMRSARLLLT